MQVTAVNIEMNYALVVMGIYWTPKHSLYAYGYIEFSKEPNNSNKVPDLRDLS